MEAEEADVLVVPAYSLADDSHSSVEVAAGIEVQKIRIVDSFHHVVLLVEMVADILEIPVVEPVDLVVAAASVVVVQKPVDIEFSEALEKEPLTLKLHYGQDENTFY